MSNIALEKKSDKAKELKTPKSKFATKILKDVEFIKLAEECRVCMRLKHNGGTCGGREGLNVCLGFKKVLVQKQR